MPDRVDRGPRWVAVWLVACAWGALAPLHAAEAPSAVPVVSQLVVGFAGRHKVGYWTPVRVGLSGGATAASVRVELVGVDGDGVRTRIAAAEGQVVELPAGEERTVEGLVRLGRRASPIEVILRDPAGAVVAQRRFAPDDAPESTFRPGESSLAELWVELGPDVGLADLVPSADEASSGPRPTLVGLDSPTQLPNQADGYDAVDWLVLSAGQPEVLAQLAPEHPRRRALETWVARGGRVLLCVGGNGAELLAPAGPLAALAPGPLVETVDLTLTSALEEFAGADQPLELPVNAGALQPLGVPRLAVREGTVACREADLPLVVHQAHGLGQVVFLALDVTQPPLATWRGRKNLLARALGREVGRDAAGPERPGGRVSWLGLADLSGQLRGALDQFAGVRLIPFGLIVAILAGYIVWIGPLDYWLLKRWVGRMEVTWLTFPLAVLVLVAGAWLWADGKNGRALRANQLDLIDYDLATGLARGTTWAGVFSPAGMTADVEIVPAASGTIAADPVAHASHSPGQPGNAPAPGSPAATSGATPAATPVVTWWGLPGAGFGGLDSTALDAAGGSTEYAFAPARAGLVGVPWAVGSSKSLLGRSFAPGPPPLEATLEADADEVPRGTLTNRSASPWRDVLLAYGRWGLALQRELAPGETLDLETDLVDLERTELLTRLTERVMVFDATKKEYVRQARPYDQAGFDRAKILRQMMFFEASGGEDYVRLAHRYQADLDFSGHLRAGRAVLVARVEAPAFAWQLAGQAIPPGQIQAESFVRFLIPVRRTDEER